LLLSDITRKIMDKDDPVRGWRGQEDPGISANVEF
jgi:hypothetical protein